MSPARRYWVGQTITGFVLAVIFGILIGVHEPLKAYIAACITCGMIGVLGIIILTTRRNM